MYTFPTLCTTYPTHTQLLCMYTYSHCVQCILRTPNSYVCTLSSHYVQLIQHTPNSYLYTLSLHIVPLNAPRLLLQLFNDLLTTCYTLHTLPLFFFYFIYRRATPRSPNNHKPKPTNHHAYWNRITAYCNYRKWMYAVIQQCKPHRRRAPNLAGGNFRRAESGQAVHVHVPSREGVSARFQGIVCRLWSVQHRAHHDHPGCHHPLRCLQSSQQMSV